MRKLISGIFCISLFFLALPSADALEIRPVWSYKFNEEIKIVRTAEDFLVVGFEDSFYVLSRDGGLLWNYNSGDRIHAISIMDERIAVVSTHNLYIFNKNGNLEWEKELGSWVGYEDAISVSEEKIALGLMNGNVYVFDIKSEQEEFQYTTDAYVLALYMLNGKLIIVSDKRIYLFDEDGNLKLEHHPESYIRFASISGSWTGVALGNNSIELYKVNEGLKWSYGLKDDKTGPILLLDDYLISGTKKGSLQLFDFHGKLIWTRNLGNSVTHIAMIDEDIIVSTLDNKLYIFTRKGTQNWNYASDEKISMFDYSPDGKYLIVGTSEGMLHSFQTILESQESSLSIILIMLGITILFIIMFYRAVSY